MDERFAKLDKYFEAGTPKKHQRSESTTNGSKGALNVKIATRMKSVNQNIEDPPKNIYLNKRARTSMAEFQANGQINRPKNQPVAMAKGVNSVNNNGERSNQFEKNRRLDAVEEGWDKKIKRKRSIGTILSKPNDSDSGIMFKRSAQNRAINEQHGVQQHQRDNNHKPSFGQSQSQSQKPPKVPRTRSSSNLVSEDDRSPSNRSLKITVKLDKHQFRIKDSGGGERQTRGKMGTNTGPSVTLPKKNKSVVNEESVWKQGRTARGLMVKKCSIPPMGKELDILQKNVSKSGRRLKRLSEYKGLSNDAPLQNSPSPHSTGESDHDKEELLSAAYHPSVPTTSSSPSWKNLVPQFPPITFNENSLLSQQQQLCLDSLPYVKTKPHTPRQQPGSPFFKKHEVDYKSCPIYERVLSAIILQEGDDIDGLVDWDHPRSFPISTSDSNNNNFIGGGQSLGLTKKSQNHSTSYEEMCSEGFFGSHEYEQMCVDDKLLIELQCIGICLDTLPGLEDNEDVYIRNEVDNLQTQQGSSSKGSSGSGNPKVPKEIATCHKSDKNCFNEFPLNDILSPQVNTTTTKKRSNRTPTKPPKKTDLPPTPKGKSVNKPPPRRRHVNETVNNRRDIKEGNDHFTPPPVIGDLGLIDEELGAVGDFDALLSFNEGEDDDVDYSVGLAVPDDDLMGLGF